MKLQIRLLSTLFVITLVCGIIAKGQVATGGTYTLEQAVIASGGGPSSGGTFGVTGTSGQPAAGTTSTGGIFSTTGGFWPQDFAPSAAGVTLAGRVTTANGNGIRNAVLTLTDTTGITRTARTGSFGYYSFDDVIAGETYVISIASKRFVFANPTQVISVNDNIVDLDFTAME